MWIDFSNNYIDNISVGFLKIVGYIDLFGNRIYYFDRKFFCGLYNLKLLNLEKNWINILLMYKGFFVDLYFFIKLNLKGNI